MFEGKCSVFKISPTPYPGFSNKSEFPIDTHWMYPTLSIEKKKTFKFVKNLSERHLVIRRNFLKLVVGFHIERKQAWTCSIWRQIARWLDVIDHVK